MEKIFALTGTKNEAELEEYIKNMQTDSKELKDQNASLEDKLEEQKKELKVAKTVATKAGNALEKAKADTAAELKALQDTVNSQNVELAERARVMDELENENTILRKNQSKEAKNALSTKHLKELALTVMNQQGIELLYITLEGNAFLKENQAFNNSGYAYKIAEKVDGNVVLKSPK